MRSTMKTAGINGSSVLKFNPQSLWRKAFQEGPSSHAIISDAEDTVAAAGMKRLNQHQALYLSEPDDVRKCIEKLLPNQIFNLVLTNKTVC